MEPNRKGPNSLIAGKGPAAVAQAFVLQFNGLEAATIQIRLNAPQFEMYSSKSIRNKHSYTISRQ